MWPPLPDTGFIKGRAATKQDFESGVAAFYLESAGGKPEGRPLDIQVPQYALLSDEKSGTDVPVIIIQAETNGSSEIVGCRAISDSVIWVVALKEVRLLGTDMNKLPAPNNALERAR